MAESSSSDNKGLAIVLLSGGLDSCVTTAIANEKHTIALLHVGYSQRTQSQEYKSFRAIANYYKVPEIRIFSTKLDYLRKIGGSSLTDPDIPVDKDNTNKHVPMSYVPFRNTHLLSIAVSWAEVIKAEKIYIGAVQQDSPDYPDCRAEYYDAFNRRLAWFFPSNDETIDYKLTRALWFDEQIGAFYPWTIAEDTAVRAKTDAWNRGHSFESV